MMKKSVHLIPYIEFEIRNKMIFKNYSELKELKQDNFVIINRLCRYEKLDPNTSSWHPNEWMYLCVKRNVLQILKNKPYKFSFRIKIEDIDYYTDRVDLFIVFENEIDRFEFELKR